MPIYDFDGYEDYPTAQLAREHVRVEGGANVAIVAGGRNGGSRLRCLGTNSVGVNTGRVSRAIAASPATLAWGTYLQIDSLLARTCFFSLQDATTCHVVIAANPDGSLVAFRAGQSGDFGNNLGGPPLASAAQLGVSAPGVVVAGQPFAFKATVTIHDTNGVVILYVNGAAVLTINTPGAVDTRNGGTATITQLVSGACSPSGNTGYVYFDDFWCGSDMLPGDRRVDSHLPIQDGTLAGFTPSSGVSHYAMVDETVPDDDTTKVTAVAPGTRETYKVEAFKNPGGTIDAVKTVLTVKKVEANSAQLATCIYSDGAPHDGVAQGLTTTWMNIGEVAETDPGTGAAWAESAFGAEGSAEFGQHKAA